MLDSWNDLELVEAQLFLHDLIWHGHDYETYFEGQVFLSVYYSDLSLRRVRTYLHSSKYPFLTPFKPDATVREGGEHYGSSGSIVHD